MRFFCVVRDEEVVAKFEMYSRMKEACEKRGVEWVVIESEKVGLSSLIDMKLGVGDIVYCQHDDKSSGFAERLLL
ncbi:hypothetical protein FWD07_02615 [Candidatus Saccharibacteria bacterium]|nr:hypothetical protein [Candidatus Saccharibacteria bacterium]